MSTVIQDKPGSDLMTTGTPLVEKRTCGAKSKRTGLPCTVAPMPNGRCYHHGGATPKGMAHPSYKHGQTSRYVPPAILPAYHSSVNDPDRLSNYHGIGLLDGRAEQVLRDMQHGNGHQRVVEAAAILRQTRRPEDMNALLAAIDVMSNERAAWAELLGIIEQRRKLTDSEIARELKAKTSLTIEDATQLVTTLQTSQHQRIGELTDDLVRAGVDRTVAELCTRNYLRSVANDVARLTGRLP